jgi:hypothetical protein
VGVTVTSYRGLLVGCSVLAILAIAYVGFISQQPSPAKDELALAMKDVQAILLSGDQQSLRRICTPDGWKYVNDCYDFHLSALRFKGTFTDFMRFCGDTMRSSDPTYVVRKKLDGKSAIFFFDRSMPEGVTVAFRKDNGKWLVAGFSPGEIDPNIFFPRSSETAERR